MIYPAMARLANYPQASVRAGPNAIEGSARLLDAESGQRGSKAGRTSHQGSSSRVFVVNSGAPTSSLSSPRRRPVPGQDPGQSYPPTPPEHHLRAVSAARPPSSALPLTAAGLSSAQASSQFSTGTAGESGNPENGLVSALPQGPVKAGCSQHAQIMELGSAADEFRQSEFNALKLLAESLVFLGLVLLGWACSLSKPEQATGLVKIGVLVVFVALNPIYGAIAVVLVMVAYVYEKLCLRRKK